METSWTAGWSDYWAHTLLWCMHLFHWNENVGKWITTSSPLIIHTSEVVHEWERNCEWWGNVCMCGLTPRSGSCCCGWRHTSRCCPVSWGSRVQTTQRTCQCLHNSPICPGNSKRTDVTSRQEMEKKKLQRTHSLDTKICHLGDQNQDFLFYFDINIMVFIFYYKLRFSHLNCNLHTNIVFVESDIGFMYAFKTS